MKRYSNGSRPKSNRRWIEQKHPFLCWAGSINDTLKIKREVKYKIDGVISNTQENYSVDLVMPDGEVFKGAESVLNIIRLIDGQKTIEEIIGHLIGQNNEMDSKDTEYIINLFNLLVKKSVLEKI